MEGEGEGVQVVEGLQQPSSRGCESYGVLTGWGARRDSQV